MLPIQISYHGVEPSDALSELVRLRAAQLARLSDRILSLRVVVEPPSHHHRHGHFSRVRIEATLPGRELVVTPEADGIGEDAYQSVRRAFDVLRRRVAETQARRQDRQRAHAQLRSIRRR